MVELRKRPAPAAPAPAPPAKKKTSTEPKPKKNVPAASKVAEPVKAADPVAEAPADQAATSGPPAVGASIALDGFGGEVETNEGEKTTLSKLVAASESGVVLFTYPKASTPGCTTQACLFRDSYEPFAAAGLRVYGLSTDSPKANTTFQTKQKLQYPLLCDPAASLIDAIGFKKAPKGTTRGVFVVDKQGKVLAREAGGPAATVEVVKKIVEQLGATATATGDKEAAETAAEVADSAEKVDATA